MEQYYTSEKNVQILIALLKAHGIKRIIVSPGSTNVTFVGSVQQDSFFEIYSCVDERSAAYMACGMAAESETPVAISCTGATASRNYFSALTEAFYRKLPILVITSTQDVSKVGHLIPQVIDRECQPRDTVKYSAHLQTVDNDTDAWDCMIKANTAILELYHHGAGPVHINLTTTYSRDFSVKTLPIVRKISRVNIEDEFPVIKQGDKVAIFWGAHLRCPARLIDAVDTFCEKYNAVVFVEPTSNYNGKYRVPYQLAAHQSIADENKNPRLLIHVGEMSDMASIVGQPQEVWRVSEDGKIVDRYHALSYVFEMSECRFFEKYVQTGGDVIKQNTYYEACMAVCRRLWNKLPELPFSHIWVASQLYNKLPAESVLHLGILSPLRSWGFFDLPASLNVFCNQGGFGIDGNMSSLVGASLVHPDRLYFGVVGDLSFFYDMNILGNRHVSKNVRILLVNNSLGAEFHLFKQLNTAKVNNIDRYISAGGHFGHKSPQLVKHFAEDLGFEYITASNKEEFLSVYDRFIKPDIGDRPIVFEVFTEVDDENEALRAIMDIEASVKNRIKKEITNVVGQDVIDKVKDIKKIF